MMPRTHRPLTRPRPAHGLTLVETLVAMGLLGLVATLGLRIVFLTDRAMSRDASAAAAAADALSFAAQFRDDVQAAQAISAQSTRRIHLTLASGARVVYMAAEEGGTVRLCPELAGKLEAEKRVFPGITVSFTGSDASLVKAKITDDSGAEITVRVYARNTMSAGPPDHQAPY